MHATAPLGNRSPIPHCVAAESIQSIKRRITHDKSRPKSHTESDWGNALCRQFLPFLPPCANMPLRGSTTAVFLPCELCGEPLRALTAHSARTLRRTGGQAPSPLSDEPLRGSSPLLITDRLPKNASRGMSKQGAYARSVRRHAPADLFEQFPPLRWQ